MPGLVGNDIALLSTVTSAAAAAAQAAAASFYRAAVAGWPALCKMMKGKTETEICCSQLDLGKSTLLTLFLQGTDLSPSINLTTPTTLHQSRRALPPSTSTTSSRSEFFSRIRPKRASPPIRGGRRQGRRHRQPPPAPAGSSLQATFRHPWQPPT